MLFEVIYLRTAIEPEKVPLAMMSPQWSKTSDPGSYDSFHSSELEGRVLNTSQSTDITSDTH